MFYFVNIKLALLEFQIIVILVMFFINKHSIIFVSCYISNYGSLKGLLNVCITEIMISKFISIQKSIETFSTRIEPILFLTINTNCKTKSKLFTIVEMPQFLFCLQKVQKPTPKKLKLFYAEHRVRNQTQLLIKLSYNRNIKKTRRYHFSSSCVRKDARRVRKIV